MCLSGHTVQRLLILLLVPFVLLGKKTTHWLHDSIFYHMNISIHYLTKRLGNTDPRETIQVRLPITNVKGKLSEEPEKNVQKTFGSYLIQSQFDFVLNNSVPTNSDLKLLWSAFSISQSGKAHQLPMRGIF